MLRDCQQDMTAWAHGSMKPTQYPDVIIDMLENVESSSEVEGLLVRHRSGVELREVSLRHATPSMSEPLREQLATSRAKSAFADQRLEDISGAAAYLQEPIPRGGDFRYELDD